MLWKITGLAQSWLILCPSERREELSSFISSQRSLAGIKLFAGAGDVGTLPRDVGMVPALGRRCFLLASPSLSPSLPPPWVATLSFAGLLLFFSCSRAMVRMLPFHRPSSTKPSRVVAWSWLWGLLKVLPDHGRADNGCICLRSIPRWRRY
jgi:hypothetical protein